LVYTKKILEGELMESIIVIGVMLLIMGLWRLFVEHAIKVGRTLPEEDDPCRNENIKPRKPQDYL